MSLNAAPRFWYANSTPQSGRVSACAARASAAACAASGS